MLTTPVRLALFYAAVFAAIGVHLPFWPVWLAAQGLSPAQISILLTAGTCARLIGNPVFAGLADATGERKRWVVLLAAGALAAFSLFAAVEGFWALLAVSFAVGLLWSAIVPLAESLALARGGVDYSRIRLFGSVAFMLASAAAGALFEGRGAAPIWWALMLALGLQLAASAALPSERPQPNRVRSRAPMRALLKTPSFLLFLAAAGCAQASHAMLYGFGSLHWREAGLSERTIGLLWAEGVVAEIGLFAAGGWLLRRFSPLDLLLLAAAAGMLRWSATALTTELAALAAIQLLHAVTFAAGHLGAMHYMLKRVPPDRANSAQGLYAVAVGALAFGPAMLASGPIYAAWGGHGFFAMAALSACALAGVLRLRRA